MIQRTRHLTAVPALPETLRGLRVAHLTDLHRSHLTSDRLLRHAIALANAEHPDIVLLTGDFVTLDPEDIAPCARIVSGLHGRFGVYACLGNHDYSAGARQVERALTHVGVHVLVNRSVCVAGGLWIVGLDDDRYGKPDVLRAFDGIGVDEPALVLIHNPAYAENLASRSCVVFSGHTHGGQVRLPVLTARELRSIGAKHYCEGWYTVGNLRMYVNRGLGQVGLPIRFLCRPEVAFFTLLPPEPGGK